MATGNINYWNGESGWIKQSGVSNLPTAYSLDVLFLVDAIVSGAAVLGAPVTFTIGTDDLAHGIVIG